MVPKGNEKTQDFARAATFLIFCSCSNLAPISPMIFAAFSQLKSLLPLILALAHKFGTIRLNLDFKSVSCHFQWRTQDWGQGGPKLFSGKVADRVKQSRANKVSFHGLGSRAHLKALEALGFFFVEYAFFLFSRYLFMIFLKQLNTNLSWYNCPSNRKNFPLYIHAPRLWSPHWLKFFFFFW